MALIADFLRSVGQLGDGRFVWVLIKALLLTVLLLLAVGTGAVWFVGTLPTSLGDWPWVGEVSLPSLGLQGVTALGLIVASPFLMIPVAAIFVGFFLDDIADAVERRHYPHLPPPRRIGWGENILTALRFLALIVVLNLVALIPYLVLLFTIPPLALALMIVVNGYLLGREYFELVAARRMPMREVHAVRRRYGFRTWFAGCLMAAALAVPLMNLLIPLLGVATITHQYHRLTGSGRPLERTA